MNYDNDRDRLQFGYDAGTIVDGVVVLDESTGEYVVLDEDGVAFSSQDLLKRLLGKKVRTTCISFDAIQSIEQMLIKTGQSSSDSSSE